MPASGFRTEARADGNVTPLSDDDEPEPAPEPDPECEPEPVGDGSFSHIWRSKDHDYPCTPTGDEQCDDAGRIYARVRTPDGSENFVPKDELVPKGEPEDEEEPDDDIKLDSGDTNDIPPDIPADTWEVICSGVEDNTLRGRAFWNVMIVLKRLGFTVDGIIELLQAHPDGIAKRYRGRLHYEIERAYSKLRQEQQHDQAPDYGEQGPQVPPLPFRRHGEKEPLDDRAWLIDSLIPEVGTGVLAGQWGTLKTFVALDLAQCVMTARRFLDFDIARPGGVLLLALEGQSEVSIRIQGALENKGTEYHKGAPFYWCETCPPLTDPKTAQVIIATAKAATAEFKQRFNLPLSLILIDSLVAGAGYSKEGQDNDAAIAHKIMMVAAEVSRALGCFVFVIDHYGKDTNVGTRGSSVKEGDADVIIACLGDRNEAGQVKNSRAALRKRRAGPNGEEFAFQGKVVDMGLNPKTGRQETTLVIEWADGGDAGQPGKPKKDDWGRGKAIKLLRRIIMSMLGECGEQITPFGDGPVVRALKLDLVAAEFFKRYVTTGEDEKAKKHAKRAAFNRAMADAGDRITGREIGDVDYIWLSQKGPGETVGAAAGRGPADEERPPPA